MGRETSHQSRLLKALPSLDLNAARDGSSTVSLGKLFQRLTLKIVNDLGTDSDQRGIWIVYLKKRSDFSISSHNSLFFVLYKWESWNKKLPMNGDSD